jgi:putative endonuclease
MLSVGRVDAKNKTWTPAYAGVTRSQRLLLEPESLNIFELEVSFPAMCIHEAPCVYILASKPNGTLYVGVTSDLLQRVWQRRNDVVEGFTERYGVHRLVWYEVCGTMESAIVREKAIKEWKRAWNIRLIQERNPEWRDLYDDLL